jgi:hypothetical protein
VLDRKGYELCLSISEEVHGLALFTVASTPLVNNLKTTSHHFVRHGPVTVTLASRRIPTTTSKLVRFGRSLGLE